MILPDLPGIKESNLGILPIIRLGLSLIIIFLISNISLHSQTHYWQKLKDVEVNDILYDGEHNIYFTGFEVSMFYVWCSSDHGVNWTKLISPRLHYLAIGNNSILWGGNYIGEIYKSTDQGNTWVLALSSNDPISSLGVNGNNGIWAGTSSGKILHSSDNGNTWEVDSLTTYDIYSMAFNSQNHIFAGSRGKIHRSSDSGVTWEIIYNNPAIYAISGIVINDSNHIYANSYSNVIISKDNGNTWTEIPHPFMQLIFKDKFNNFYSWGYRSLDNCITWTYIGPVFDFGSYALVDSLIFAGTLEGLFLYDPSYQPYTGTNNFPLALGNKWQFKEINGNTFSGNSYYYVERDTIILGKRYFLLQGDVNDWVRYDNSDNILYLRWNDNDYIVMDYELNAGSVFASIWFNSHYIDTVTVTNPFYLSIFDSTYFTKGHYIERYGIGWTRDTTYYSEGLGETMWIHSVDGHGGLPGIYQERVMIRAIINDSSGVHYFSDRVKPEIIFQPALATNTFNIDWNFQVDHEYSYFSNSLNVNFVDTVIMFSYYSNEVSTFVNDPVIAINTPNSINYRITYQLDSTLMTNEYALYYKIYAVDKGIVPEHSTKPDTGYYKLVYDSTFVSVEADENIIKEYSLEQNYPNPFNPSTTISYSVPVYSNVTIKIFNVLGQQIASLVNEEKLAGRYEVVWNSEGLPSGIYIYQLNAVSFTDSRKMILMK